MCQSFWSTTLFNGTAINLGHIWSFLQEMSLYRIDSCSFNQHQLCLKAKWIGANFFSLLCPAQTFFRPNAFLTFLAHDFSFVLFEYCFLLISFLSLVLSSDSLYREQSSKRNLVLNSLTVHYLNLAHKFRVAASIEVTNSNKQLYNLRLIPSLFKTKSLWWDCLWVCLVIWGLC